MRFVESSFAAIEAELVTGRENEPSFSARLIELADRKVATSKDFDPETGVVKGSAQVLDEATGSAVTASLEGAPWPKNPTSAAPTRHS